ncbi:MAG: twin-arginine translocase subunit TatC [Candidatus Eiseniibacteriota bacterium]|nr:MAG: twin-arginine translocase subunit TatC [Candidatus Eisenbacteria bacterium]
MNDREKQGSEEKEMPFLEHLEELRRVVIDSLIAVAVVSAGCWFLSGRAIDLLIVPIGKAVFIGPAEAFTVRLKLAVVLGLLISLPFVFLRLWRFVVPGLLRRERTALLPLALFSSILFYGGVAFSYFMLVPAIMRILLAFGTDSLEPMISIDKYLSLVIQIGLSLGLVFQFPLVVGVLTWLGVLTPDSLKRKWRYAIVIIFIIGAAVTPGDGPSQLVVAFPVTGLYFLSILVSMVVHRRKDAETENDDDDTENDN